MNDQRTPLREYPLRKWPGFFLALFTEAKSFRDNPLIGSPLLNRLGLHVLRVVLAHCILNLRWLLLSPWVSREDRRSFRRQGYIVRPNILEPTALAMLRERFDALLPHFKQTTQGDTVTRQLLLSPEQLQSDPALQALLNNKTYIGLQRYASGFFLLPWLFFLRVENGVQAAAQYSDPQKVVHADAFHPTMKSWLFLEAVSAEKGPFTYYPGSHRLTWRRLKWEYQRSINASSLRDHYSEKGSFRVYPEDLEALGLGAPVTFTVPANTLVVANTFGFHCRGSAESGAIRDAVWSSGWRAPFLPVPLPDGRSLRRFFYRQMADFLTRRSHD